VDSVTSAQLPPLCLGFFHLTSGPVLLGPRSFWAGETSDLSFSPPIDRFALMSQSFPSYPPPSMHVL